MDGVVASSIKAAEEATAATIPPEVMEKCMATAEVGIRSRRWVGVFISKNHEFENGMKT